MLIKFLTALAWIIGSGCAFCCFMMLVALIHFDKSQHEKERSQAAFWLFICIGLAPWAWLLARYCL